MSSGIFKKTSIIKSYFCHFASYTLFGGGFWLADQQSQPIRSLQLFIIKNFPKKVKIIKVLTPWIWKKNYKIFYFSIRSHFFFQKQTQYLGLFHLLLMTCFLSEINSCDYVRSFCSEFIIYTKYAWWTKIIFLTEWRYFDIALQFFAHF